MAAERLLILLRAALQFTDEEFGPQPDALAPYLEAEMTPPLDAIELGELRDRFQRSCVLYVRVDPATGRLLDRNAFASADEAGDRTHRLGGVVVAMISLSD